MFCKGTNQNSMTKDTFLELAASKYAESEKSGQLNSFYDHEKQFAQIWIELGRKALEQRIGEVMGTIGLKKILSRYGRLEIAKQS